MKGKKKKGKQKEIDDRFWELRLFLDEACFLDNRELTPAIATAFRFIVQKVQELHELWLGKKMVSDSGTLS